MGTSVEKKNKIISIMPGISWVILGFFMDIFFLIKYGKRLLDADMASEMVLADLLNKEHSITGLSTNWCYSTEIRVLNMQYLYRLGLLFSPNNWHIARVIAMAIALVLLAFAIWLLFKTIDIPVPGLYAAAFCLFPGGSWYFFYAIFGGYYIPYILISVISLTLLFYLFKQKNKTNEIITIIPLLIIGLLSGLNGVKQLMVFYAPVVIAAFIFTLIKYHDKENKSEQIRSRKMLLYVLLAAFSSFVGFIINSKILSRKYSFYNFNESVIQTNSIWDFFQEYLYSFGFSQGVKLLSFKGVASMLGLMIGFLTIICAFRLMFRFKKLDFNIQFLSLFSTVSICFCVFIFSFVENSLTLYFTPIIPISLLLIILELVTEDYSYKYSKTVCLNVLLVVMFIVSIGTLLNEFSNPIHRYNAKQTMGTVVDELLQKGYDKGIASFWNSNIITELSDGKIEMWTLEYYDPEAIYPWLQKKEHCEALPDSNYFFIYEKVEDASYFLSVFPDLEMIYDDGVYVIYAKGNQ